MPEDSRPGAPAFDACARLRCLQGMVKPFKAGRAKLLVLLAALTVLFSCSHRDDESANEAPDASTGAAAIAPAHDGQAHDVAGAIQKAFAPMPTIAARFAPNVDGFAKTKDGVTSPGW